VRCQRCDADHVRRSGRAGALVRLLSAAYIYPFRCQRCGRRFFALTWGARYARPTSERREFERVVIRLPAKLTGGAESAEAAPIAGRQTRVRRLSFEVVLVALVGLVLIVLLLQLFGGGGPGG